MQLKVGDTLFRDSLLHLPGSISSLARDCLQGSGIDLEKGEFPHFFNRVEYKNYVGPLPDDSFYDLKFTMKTEQDWEKHRRFRQKWEGRNDWDAEKMLLEYCQNDVEILAAIMKYHHETCKNLLRTYEPQIAISPWFSVTSAGYVHRITLLEQSLQIEDDISFEKTDQLAETNWIALEPIEHYFAKKALRGGRTEVRKFYHKVKSGEKIKCVDVHSMYPSIQIGKSIKVDGKEYPLLFPVGAPIIEVFDTDYYPCHKYHFTDPSKPCFCTLTSKIQGKSPKVTINIKNDPIDLNAYIRNFDGIIMVDVIPPRNMYHPILPVYDEETKKCVFSCEPIYKKTFASPQLKLAIDHGYNVTKIYRADRYKMMPSKWRGLLGNMYLMKYYSSSNGDKSMLGESIDEMRKRHVDFYDKHYDLDIDFNKCKKRPAMKLSSKILINSAWGKHAESVDHIQSLMIGEEDNSSNNVFMHRISNEEINVKSYQKLGNRTLFKYEDLRNDETKSKPNVHRLYLPAAVFVPMYGQMMVWNILNIVGERALMCDTDSVKYISNGIDPDITPSDGLGTWEDEGNLTEFVSIGLKSYALRYESEKPDSIKLKGCCLKYSHRNLINFESMVAMLKQNQIINIPQLSFDYVIGEGISTREFLKTVKFDADILKGNYNSENYQLYPFGYQN